MVGRLLLMCAILLMGLISGFFYAYGSTVLAGFDALPPSDAVRAMQAINAQARNWMFAPSFFGALIVSAMALVYFAGVRHWPVAGLVGAGVSSYVFGGFLITLILNVPLNESIAPLDPARPDIAGIASAYFESWRFWNWVRTFASLLALGLLVMAFREEGRQKD